VDWNGRDESAESRKIAAQAIGRLSERPDVPGLEAGLRLVNVVESVVFASDGTSERGLFTEDKTSLTSLWLPYAVRFMEAYYELGALDVFPVLRGLQNDFQLPIAVDYKSSRAMQSIFYTYILRGKEYQSHDFRAPIAVTPLSIDYAPRPFALESFVTLFVHGFRWLRSTVSSSRSPSHVNFTVDCTNYGYQLEYFPQFFYSPTVFGGTLTRPVTASIPVNHYHFQGWKNSVLTQDTGLYRADSSSTAATLRAF
jgi:hypothetical protein